MNDEIYAALIVDLDRAIQFFQKNSARIRTGRANPALLDGIKVNYYNTPTLIKNLANISVPDPRQIVIQPWDATIIPSIEKEILKSDLGVTPVNDGKVIRINIPPLTEDRRKDLVKVIAKMNEECKVSLRQSRRDALDKIKQLEKDKAISEDDRKRAEPKIQSLLNEFVQKSDEIFKLKEKEILEV